MLYLGCLYESLDELTIIGTKHYMKFIQTSDTCSVVLRLIQKEKNLGWESNPQPSQLWCDLSNVKLPSPWEQGGGELGINMV